MEEDEKGMRHVLGMGGGSLIWNNEVDGGGRIEMVVVVVVLVVAVLLCTV